MLPCGCRWEQRIEVYHGITGEHKMTVTIPKESEAQNVIDEMKTHFPDSDPNIQLIDYETNRIIQPMETINAVRGTVAIKYIINHQQTQTIDLYNNFNGELTMSVTILEGSPAQHVIDKLKEHFLIPDTHHNIQLIDKQTNNIIQPTATINPQTVAINYIIDLFDHQPPSELEEFNTALEALIKDAEAAAVAVIADAAQEETVGSSSSSTAATTVAAPPKALESSATTAAEDTPANPDDGASAASADADATPSKKKKKNT